MVRLAKRTDEMGQPRFVSSRGALVNKAFTGSFIDNRNCRFQFSSRRLFGSLGSDVFDSLAQTSPEGTVADALSLGSLHALGTGFMIRQNNTFRFHNNKLAYKYNRHSSLVNQ